MTDGRGLAAEQGKRGGGAHFRGEGEWLSPGIGGTSRKVSIWV